MKFTKMQGTGNDFIIFQDLLGQYNNLVDLAKKLCDRHFGIGADGILVVGKSNIADIKMVIINIDGSFASMCGNGIRCFAKYVYDNGIVKKDKIYIETGDGIKIAYLDIENNQILSVRINMGKPDFKPENIPALAEKQIINEKYNFNGKDYIITSLLMGVPHTVIIGDIDGFDVNEGHFIEKNKLFPEGTNINFCQVISSDKLRVKTWERGAGPTLSCGTGSCASVVVANKLGFIGTKAEVQVPGGKLSISLEEEGVFLSGPAKVSFTGEVEL
jgi:diaminopimelate epimerase